MVTAWRGPLTQSFWKRRRSQFTSREELHEEGSPSAIKEGDIEEMISSVVSSLKRSGWIPYSPRLTILGCISNPYRKTFVQFSKVDRLPCVAAPGRCVPLLQHLSAGEEVSSFQRFWMWIIPAMSGAFIRLCLVNPPISFFIRVNRPSL